MLIRLLRRAPDERVLLVRALLGVCAFRLALGILPFATVWGLAWRLGKRGTHRLRRAGSVSPPVDIQDATCTGGRTRHARHVATPLSCRQAVEAVARRLPGTSCLTRALVLYVLLARRGVAARLCLGLAKPAAGQHPLAHAWVEVDGAPLPGEVDLGRYTRLACLGGPPR